LNAGQAGSASDLLLYLISTYQLAKVPVDSVSRARVVQLLRLFKPSEPTLKKIAQEITLWSSKSGNVPYGDPELNHVLGTIFVKAGEGYLAERYLLLGTRESPALLADFLYEWSTELPQQSTEAAGMFMSRGVLSYLVLQNIRDARKFTSRFLEKLASNAINAKAATESDSEILVFDDVPLINFLQLLIITCQYKNADMYGRLKQRYRDSVIDRVDELKGPLDIIGKVYFGIHPARQANVLQDLMGSLFA
jgi:hypothetical protein